MALAIEMVGLEAMAKGMDVLDPTQKGSEGCGAMVRHKRTCKDRSLNEHRSALALGANTSFFVRSILIVRAMNGPQALNILPRPTNAARLIARRKLAIASKLRAE